MEPARDRRVYDEHDEEPVIRPDLRAISGGGEATQPKRGHLRSVGSEESSRKRSLQDAENSSGEGVEDVASHKESGALADKLGRGYTGKNDEDERSLPVNGKKRKQNWLAKVTKKRAAVGLTTLVIGGGGFFAAFSILQGPAQLVQLAEILKKPEFGTEKNTNTRLGAMYRYWRTGDVGETRVGRVGSKTFRGTISQLKEIGIDFERSPLTGKPRYVTLDTSKNPRYQGMSADEAVRKAASDLGVPENKVSRFGFGADGTGHKIHINTEGVDAKGIRNLAGNVANQIPDGKVVTGMRARVLAKFFNAPSLFNPIHRAIANKENQIVERLERKQREQKRMEAKREPVESRFSKARANLKERFGSKVGISAGALLITTEGMCLVRNSADDAAEVNRGVAVMSALEATDKKAVGSQAQSGIKINMQSVGDIITSFTDENGDSIWGSKELREMGDPTNKGGVELPDEYKQVFYPGSTANDIKKTLGGGSFGALACSTVGLIVQGTVGLGLVLVGPLTGGGSWAVVAVRSAGAMARVAPGAIATSGAMYMLSQKLTDLLSDKEVIPNPISGPLGGSILAWGSVEAANIPSRAYGGVPLSSSEVLALNQERYAQETDQFNNKDLAARIFDINESRALAGKLAIAMPTDIMSGIRKIANGLINFPSMAGDIFSSIMPNVTAQDSAEDEFDFEDMQRTGIPAAVMNDPDLQDPYENAAAAGRLFEGSAGSDYMDKAMRCFGTNINKNDGTWNAAPEKEVNPNSEEYVSANCGDTRDPNWRRTIMFVFDTSIANATACFDGEDEFCADIGVATGSNSSTTTSATSGSNIEGLECPPGELQTKQVGDTTYYQVPEAPNGEYTFDPGAVPSQRYGQKELICVIYTAAIKYKEKYGNKSTVKVGDLNASGHDSHQWGIAVDINAWGDIAAADTTHANYNTEATVEFGKILVSTGKVKNIWWCPNDNSSQEIAAYAKSIGKPLTIKCIDGHENHFHVDITAKPGPSDTPS